MQSVRARATLLLGHVLAERPGAVRTSEELHFLADFVASRFKDGSTLKGSLLAARYVTWPAARVPEGREIDGSETRAKRKEGKEKETTRGRLERG